MSFLETQTAENAEKVIVAQSASTAEAFAGMDEVNAGFEAIQNEIDSLDVALITADMLEESMALDQVGIESGNVTPSMVMMSANTTAVAMALGLQAEAPAMPGMESVENDPAAELKVGLEAKDGIIKKIIKKAKAFIAMIVRNAKKAFAKMTSFVSTLFMNAEKLREEAEDLDTGAKVDLKGDDEDVKDTRKKLSKYLGVIGIGKTTLETIIEDSTMPFTAEAFNALYTDIKAAESKDAAKLIADTKTEIDGAKVKLATYGSEKDKLALALLARTDIVAVSTIATTTTFTVNALTASKKDGVQELGKDSFKITLSTSGDSLLKKEYVRNDIIAMAKKLETSMKINKPSILIDLMTKQTKEIDGDISDLGKANKSKALKATVKFGSFYSAGVMKALSGSISTHKSVYAATKLLIAEAS